MNIISDSGQLNNEPTLFAAGPNKALFAVVMIALPLVVGLIAIAIGRYSIPIPTVWDVLTAPLTGSTDASAQVQKVIWSIRVPRVILALLVGAGLSVAGLTFQSLFANPLATPDTLGVASGASLGAVIGLFFGVGLIQVQLLALGFGVIAISVTYLVSRSKKSNSLTTVVLAGIIVGSLFTALISLVKYVADTESQLPSIVYWLMGSLNSASYDTLALGAPFIIIGCVLLFSLRWRLNILPLSEDEARASGTNLKALRAITVLSATMITASCVSMCGQVGWVGLLIPHICRMKFGSNNLLLVPASISIGAVFMVVIDTIARSATAAEIPVSILTALIGAPFFISLLRKTGGWSL